LIVIEVTACELSARQLSKADRRMSSADWAKDAAGSTSKAHAAITGRRLRGEKDWNMAFPFTKLPNERARSLKRL